MAKRLAQSFFNVTIVLLTFNLNYILYHHSTFLLQKTVGLLGKNNYATEATFETKVSNCSQK